MNALMRFPRTSIVTALAVVLAACAASQAEAQAFPRVGLYGQVLGGGHPYVKPDFTLDTLEIARTARYNEVVLDAFPISPYRPDIVLAIKARNPACRVLAYVLAQDIWQVNDADSLRHIPTLIRHKVRDLGGFLYDKNTGQEYPTLAINIAKKVSGRYVVAEAMADIFRDHIIAAGYWNGIFTDIFCHTVSWTQGGTTRVIDYQRAGYASLAALDLGWSEACDVLAARLRQDGGPTFTLVGNCAASSEHAYYSGWMRENFPYQQGGTWESNMLGDVSSRGYLADDRDYRQPPKNWILGAANPTAGQEYAAYNTGKVRYGLASAALGEGVHAFTPSRSVMEAPYQQWWYDEYAVDLSTGRSSTSQVHTGWLGSALGPARTWMWANTSPDAITNTSFETNVTIGWQFVHFAPAAATFARDATTGAVGSASAKISVTTASSVEWHVYISSVGQLFTTAGTSYSATFWAKANPARRVHVLAGNSGGQAYVDVDPTWRQYQVVLKPTTTISSSLTFWLGTQTGDVWFDDVHFQSGATNVWRRDFQNGIVLVNPTELSMTVPLEGQFRRLLGTRTPGINTGALSNSMTIGAFDALFLLRGALDSTAPARTSDLRVGP
jgi:hypothetical protein